MFTKRLISAGVVGLLVSAAQTTSVLAWHPVGVITKQVQNQTTVGPLADANDASSAVQVKTGDIVKYVITVRNDGNPDANGWNDMASVTLSDTLPTGTELVSNPAERAITVDLGTILPGKQVSKEYVVKVTATENKKVIENKACFTGNSTVNDNPQSGCEVANIVTNIPQTSSTSTTTPSTTTPKPASVVSTPAVKAATTVKTLPNTGVAGVLFYGLLASVIGYAYSIRRMQKRA